MHQGRVSALTIAADCSTLSLEGAPDAYHNFYRIIPIEYGNSAHEVLSAPEEPAIDICTSPRVDGIH